MGGFAVGNWPRVSQYACLCVELLPVYVPGFEGVCADRVFVLTSWVSCCHLDSGRDVGAAVMVRLRDEMGIKDKRRNGPTASARYVRKRSCLQRGDLVLCSNPLGLERER